MHFEFERVDETVRLFVDGDTHGDTWQLIAAVRYLAADTVRVVGLTRAPLPKGKQAKPIFGIRSAMVKACRERGCTRVEYSRRQNGEWVDKVIKVPA